MADFVDKKHPDSLSKGAGYTDFDDETNNFIYNINFNSSDLSNQLIKLQLFTNNYFKYNDEYIKEMENKVILFLQEIETIVNNLKEI